MRWDCSVLGALGGLGASKRGGSCGLLVLRRHRVTSEGTGAVFRQQDQGQLERPIALGLVVQAWLLFYHSWS